MRPDMAGFATGSGILHAPDAERNADLDAMASTGARWVRFDLDWSQIERSRGKFDWTKPDRMVKGCLARKMCPVGLLTYCAPWAGLRWNGPPIDPVTFGIFARKAAERYTPLGVTTWEVWNEPNLSNFWYQPNATKYVDLLRRAYSALKAVSPDSFIISGGLSPYGSPGDRSGTGTVNPVTFLTELYLQGAKGYFDAMGLHPYSAPVSPAKVATWNAFQQLPLAHQVMLGKGDGGKRIWLTEYGAPTRGNSSTTEAGQAQWLTDAIRLAGEWKFCGPLLVYSHRDTGTSTTDREQAFGLLRHDRTPKSAWSVFDRSVA